MMLSPQTDDQYSRRYIDEILVESAIINLNKPKGGLNLGKYLVESVDT